MPSPFRSPVRVSQASAEPFPFASTQFDPIPCHDAPARVQSASVSGRQKPVPKQHAPTGSGQSTPAQLKPLYCRHFSDGQNHGTASLIFADGHAKSYTAASILAQQGGANLIWRFR